jgi:hypothetical protein
LEDRKSQKSIILYQASMQKIRNGDWDAAYRLAQRIDFPPQRAFIFQTLAQKFYSNKEIDRAQATLEEIWSWVEKIDSLPQKTQAMFELSAAMTLINPPRSFEISETAIKTLNSTDFSAPVPKDNDRILVDSEITAEIVQIEPLFTSLARFDFARAIQLTQLITNNEISLFAQSVACQKILRPNA